MNTRMIVSLTGKNAGKVLMKTSYKRYAHYKESIDYLVIKRYTDNKELDV